MRSRVSRALVVCAAIVAVFGLRSDVTLRASASGVVISQVYGGGGNSGATYKNDFIELFNAGTATVDITGWSVQYASSSGSSWQVTALSGSIAPGQYYLVQEAAGSAGTTPLPTPDATGGIPMGATAGKVALASSAMALSGTCPANVVDFVGFGSAANCSEGSPTATLSNTIAAIRADNGCTDTGSNSADFGTGAPTPRNRLSPLAPCQGGPRVTSTSPANGARNVPETSTITINFDQAVTASASAFQLSCGGTAQSFTSAPASGSAFTLTPASNLPTASVCSVTVVATQVTPTMPSDYHFSFVTPSPFDNAPVVISQVYGGGGNNNAVYQNDFVELYNRGAATVHLTGWSIQYASSSGSSWGGNLQPLGGTIDPGQYLLVALAYGGDRGAPLPPANLYGQINMSATAGKVALVNSTNGLTDGCPLTDPHLIDLVGYGSANCGEGGTTTSAPANPTAVLRNGDGATDTNNNRADFTVGAPNPRQTAPIVEIGPAVLNVDPAPNATTAPFDATLTINFSEAVEVDPSWFHIACVTSGGHDDATTAVSSGGRSHYITPNGTLTPGESCTATIYQNAVHDVDTDDSAPGTDTLPADFVWSFKVAAASTPPEDADVNVAMGNPSGADASTPDNYLLVKPQYTLSYNRDLGRPNWVSWHLTNDWTGSSGRTDTFRPDPAIPPEWYRVQSFDFFGSGFDRGHMDPSADRTKDVPINQATFLMSNMVAQAPDNNQGPWENLESYLRSLLPGNELYVVSGPLGVGGTGSNGYVETLADGHVAVPAYTWKVALVLPKMDGDDVSRIDCTTRTIAVLMPNQQGIQTSNPDDWMTYLTTVNDIQNRTGYNFFSNVPGYLQNCIEAGINGANPKNQPTFAIAPVSVEVGTSSTTVSGTLLAGVFPAPGSVEVTFGTDTFTVPIGSDGGFSVTLQTGTLAASSTGYPIQFAYAGNTNFEAATATATLKVVDTTPPAVSDPSPTPGTLGPVNHKMVPVTVTYTAVDLSGTTCSLRVGSNEPVNSLGDGNTSIDWQVLDAHHVQLRSERSGLGSGRIYTVLVTCTDPSGNATTKGTVVTVPK